MVQISHPYMTVGKTVALTRQTFIRKVMSLLFNTLSLFVIPFLWRSECLLIARLQSPSTVILEPKKINLLLFPLFPHLLPWSYGTDVMILVFWMLSFKPTFSLPSFIFIKRIFSSSLFSAIRVVSSVYLRLLIFLQAILIPVCDFPAQHFPQCTLHIHYMNRVTIFSLDLLLCQFGISLLFHVWF